MNTPDSTPESTPLQDDRPTPRRTTPADARAAARRRPRPMPPRRRPTARAGARRAGPAAPARTPVPDSQGRDWGRVDDDGTVYVRTADGERSVGQMPDATPEEALAFFVRRYDDLAFEVELLEQRVAAGTLGPDEATALGQAGARQPSHDAQAVGDLAGLDARLDALTEDDRRAARAAPRGAGPQARGGQGARRSASPPRPSGCRRGQRLAQRRQPDAAAARRVEGAPPAREVGRRRPVAPVLDRPDDVHPAPQGALRRAQREARRAPASSRRSWSSRPRRSPTSTEWGADRRQVPRPDAPVEGRRPGPQGRRRRSCGSGSAAPRTPSSAPATPPTPSWTREFAANAEKKEALLVEAEALVPVTDLRAAKEAFRDIAERWDAAGKVPRDRMKELEGRMRKVEQAIRGVEDDQWRRSNPEKSRPRRRHGRPARDVACADLRPTSRRPAPPATPRRSRSSRTNLESRQSFLEMARKALARLLRADPARRRRAGAESARTAC